MRVGTYNLLHGVTVLGPPRPDALHAAVASLAADVLGLQEVDVEQPRSGGVGQAAVAARALGALDWRFAPGSAGTPGGRTRSWSPVTGRAQPRSGPRYGVALLSRHPVRHWRSTVLPAAPLWLPLLVPGEPRPRLVPVRDEPRAALAAVVDGPAGPASIATTHLSFVPGWNLWQLRRLTRWLADLPRPLLLVGDLNLPGRLPARAAGMAQLATEATYPVWRPRVQLDHVLADGLDPGTAWSQVHRLPVSDHAALTVDLLDAPLR